MCRNRAMTPPLPSQPASATTVKVHMDRDEEVPPTEPVVAPASAESASDAQEESESGEDTASTVNTEELLAMDSTYLCLGEFFRSPATEKNITEVFEEVVEQLKVIAKRLEKMSSAR